ncbi:MAG: shufflon system plasmid conjugative transfer pilus tip adhesin PilV [Neisseriaceae bacterium]|nr:MAG: shufflon system plasmid conjugative transfer pilus tip adhesin PilV [Neisseriaceae bacterium]
MIKNNKLSGYTLIEILIGVAAVAIVGAGIYQLTNANMQATKSQSIANETIFYSKLFARYVLNNDTNIRNTLATNGIAFITWADLKSSGYVPTGTVNDKTMLGQTPCTIVMRNNQTNELIPLMFLIGGDGREKSFTSLNANNVSSQIGGMSGIYISDIKDKDAKRSGTGVFGNGGVWFLPSSTPYIQQIQSGCGGTPSNNSIVINIGMMSEYSGALAPDNSLHRFKDPANPTLGDQNNTNTAQTDISIAPKDNSNPNNPSSKLFFNGNSSISGMYMYSKDGKNVTLKNGSLAANTLQPLKEVIATTACSESELGSMAKEATSTNVIIKGMLICSNNPILCQGTDPYGTQLSGYCYSPTQELSITYKPNNQQAYCPSGYFLDNSVPPVVTQGNPPPIFNGSKWECWASVMGVCTNWQYVTRPACSWQSPNTTSSQIGLKTYRNFSIGTGVQAITTWQPNSQGYDCNYSDKQNTAPGVIQAFTCSSTPGIIDSN